MPAAAARMLIHGPKAWPCQWVEPLATRGSARDVMSRAHRFTGWPLTLMPPVALAIALSCVAPTPGAAQSVSLSPRVSLMEGHEVAGSMGLRAELGSSKLAVYGHGGAFGLVQKCDTSLPPSCNSPSGGGIELLGGVRLSLPRLGPTQPAVSLGAGALIWNDDDPYQSGVGNIWEAELRVGVKAFSWSDLVLGATLKSIGQSVSGGMQLGRDRGTYMGIVVGLLIPGSH